MKTKTNADPAYQKGLEAGLMRALEIAKANESKDKAIPIWKTSELIQIELTKVDFE